MIIIDLMDYRPIPVQQQQKFDDQKTYLPMRPPNFIAGLKLCLIDLNVIYLQRSRVAKHKTLVQDNKKHSSINRLWPFG